ncbi:glutaminase [Corynebacterium renale]|uniref:glutaminase n=1 Tax=Corynebacterium renale TaxID=1724 RepID=UPI000DA27959|nr:glutaminase [Corynebacterium renale]SQG65276.1 glutaminase [Corynebacterium renale]STC98566.1 glutaminase [Corynebacterium renale]
MTEHIANPIPAYLRRLLEEVRDQDGGEVADYIDELAAADPSKLGIALTTVSGHTYSAGDCDDEFSIQSISKPFVYALALQEHGLDAVHEIVGLEPSGEKFNELSLDQDKRPMNPMINAGAIVVNQLINGPDSTVEDRVDIIVDLFSRLAGRQLRMDADLSYSELKGADRNLSLAHMLRSYGMISDQAHDAVLSYTMQCSIMVTARDLAAMTATLGNGGVNPLTGEDVLDAEACRLAMSVMSSSGMYDGAGRWMARVGIPAKSGVAGGLIGTLPGQLGIATFSPRLDPQGNSVRGLKIFEKLSEEMGLHLMNPHRMGVHAVRSMQQYDDTMIITLQGTINFSAAEQILYRISQHDFTASKLVLDVTRVITVDDISRHFLASTLLKMRKAGLEISLYDPEDQLHDLVLSDEYHVPVISAEQRKAAED